MEEGGDQVRLRPLATSDVEALLAAREDDPWSFGPAGEEARRRLLSQIERPPTLGDDGLLELAVEANGGLAGTVQARAPRNATMPGVCEIGISLFPDARGRGVGRQAVRLLTERLFGEGLERVQASTAVANVAMRRVLERVGYRFEGVLRGFGPTADGGREDYAMYAVIRAEWDAGAQSPASAGSR